jgi:hypothetical protein
MNPNVGVQDEDLGRSRRVASLGYAAGIAAQLALSGAISTRRDDSPAPSVLSKDKTLKSPPSAEGSHGCAICDKTISANKVLCRAHAEAQGMLK